jgi:hypothetical protein
LAGPAILQIDLALDDVGPGRRGGVLEVGHEHLGPAVEGVDDHLAVDRTGDLDAAILKVGGDRRDDPVILPDVGGVGQEVWQLAGVEPRLAGRASRQQLAAAGVEPAVQVGHEGQGFRRQDLYRAAFDRTGDLDIGGDVEGHGGSCRLCGGLPGARPGRRSVSTRL